MNISQRPNPLASTMRTDALQRYIGLVDDRAEISRDAVRRIARSHVNVNAKLELEQARVAELTAQLEAAHLRISRAFVALGPNPQENTP